MADDGLVLNLFFNEPAPAPTKPQQQQQHQQRQPQKHQGSAPGPSSQWSPGGANGGVAKPANRAPQGSPANQGSQPGGGRGARPRSEAPQQSSHDGNAAGGRGAQNGGQRPGNRTGQAGRGQGAWSGGGRQGGSRGAAMKNKTPFDEDAGPGLRGADDDEDGDVAAMVAAVAQRDKQLEQDLSRSSKRGLPAAEGEAGAGVVEFGDAEDDEHDAAARLAKRRKWSQAGGSTAKASSTEQPQKPVKHVPGQLAHADVVPTATATQMYGSDPTTWEGLGLDARLVQQLIASNFLKPTMVQQEAIPMLLSGRDALVKAPTGSGKTLAYLVPMIHDLVGHEPRISRAEGTYAVVVAPTRELCIQIQDVATVLLRRFIWIVSSVLIGGEHRGHEKARLRKGVSIVVASPGRLQDHLEHTSSFRTHELRWLVLDEADRLLDLGFQAKLKEIISLLDRRSGKEPAVGEKRQREDEEEEQEDAAQHRAEEGEGRRRTVLLSATLHQQLGELATAIQHDPVPVGFVVKKGPSGLRVSEHSNVAGDVGTSIKELASSSGRSEPEFSIPAQLRQAFMEVPCKDRLVALAGVLRQKLLLRRPLASSKLSLGPESKHKGKDKKQGGKDADSQGSTPAASGGRKIVVFVSSCDSVELYHKLLGGFWTAALDAPLLDAPLLKLHGDMTQPERTASFLKFNQAKSAVLICTDVAARGLDFPDVSTIIQYDVPGASEDYVHRVGRTARMGHSGEALLFLMPHERPYVEVLSKRGISLVEESLPQALKWLPPPPESEMKHVAGAARGKDSVAGVMALAFALQRVIMRLISNDSDVCELAGNAFRSFTRAYATHPKDVKSIFNVRQLHLGHVAFSFGLKDTPAMIGQTGSSADRKRRKHEAAQAAQKQAKKKLYTAAQLTAGTVVARKTGKPAADQEQSYLPAL